LWEKLAVAMRVGAGFQSAEEKVGGYGDAFQIFGRRGGGRRDRCGRSVWHRG
jgi:hypothetical protein